MNSKLSVRKIEKHEIQILDCDGELKDNENWMSEWMDEQEVMQYPAFVCLFVCLSVC